MDEFGEGVHFGHLPGPGSIEESAIAISSDEGLAGTFVANIKNVGLPASQSRQNSRRRPDLHPYLQDCRKDIVAKKDCGMIYIGKEIGKKRTADTYTNMAILGSSGCWERINWYMCKDIVVIVKPSILDLPCHFLMAEHISKIMTSNIRAAKCKHFHWSALRELFFGRDMEAKDGRQSGPEAMSAYNQGIIFANFLNAVLMSEGSNLVILCCASILPYAKEIRIEACINMDLLRV